MIFSGGMDAHGEADEKNAGQGQKIRKAVLHTQNIPFQETPPVEVQQNHHGNADHGQQKQHPVVSGGDIGIEEGKEDQRHPEKPHHHAVIDIAGNPKPGVNRHHPYGDGSLVEQLFTVQKGDQRVQRGSRDWQENLAPQISRVSGPFQTGESNAGHCRRSHAQRHQPGQHVFMADIKMCSCFHTDTVY